LEAARSLTRVDACNPLLQAHPTWARDEHKGRGIPTSLTPASGRLASPPFALALALDPSGLGHAATLTRRPEGPPGLETPTRANPRSFMGVCGLGVWVYGAWHMWAQSGHMAWHMTTHTDVAKRGGS
jgi:hypothetical protein